MDEGRTISFIKSAESAAPVEQAVDKTATGAAATPEQAVTTEKVAQSMTDVGLEKLKDLAFSAQDKARDLAIDKDGKVNRTGLLTGVGLGTILASLGATARAHGSTSLLTNPLLLGALGAGGGLLAGSAFDKADILKSAKEAPKWWHGIVSRQLKSLPNQELVLGGLLAKSRLGALARSVSDTATERRLADAKTGLGRLDVTREIRREADIRAANRRIADKLNGLLLQHTSILPADTKGRGKNKDNRHTISVNDVIRFADIAMEPSPAGGMRMKLDAHGKPIVLDGKYKLSKTDVFEKGLSTAEAAKILEPVDEYTTVEKAKYRDHLANMIGLTEERIKAHDNATKGLSGSKGATAKAQGLQLRDDLNGLKKTYLEITGHEYEPVEQKLRLGERVMKALGRVRPREHTLGSFKTNISPVKRVGGAKRFSGRGAAGLVNLLTGLVGAGAAVHGTVTHGANVFRALKNPKKDTVTHDVTNFLKKLY